MLPAVFDAVDLSVVIPAFNEEARLPATLTAIQDYLHCRGRRFEIVLVDDGSRDGTLEFMERAAAECPTISVQALSENRGKGRATATGVAAARGTWILVSDADLSTPIAELAKLEAALCAGADIAIASRAKRESLEIEQPILRMMMGKTFNLVVQALLLPGLWDTQCGFKLFPGPAARELFACLQSDGFAFDVEILYRARRRGLKVVEVPVQWVHSSPSRVAPIRHSWQMLKDVFQIRYMK
jgi:dolichyl-phosphate beta-glucosyltransferase